MMDPTVGRWTSQDPLDLEPDTNPYRYVHNGFPNATDPTGLYETDIHFYMTYYLASAVGLADKPTNVPQPRGEKPLSAAYAVAWFAQHVDDHPDTGPNQFKAIMDTSAQFYHFYSLELHIKRGDFKNRAKLLAALKALGREKQFVGGYFDTVIPIPVTSDSDEVKDLVKGAMAFEKSDATFGMVLHTYEDSWSHEGFQMPIGHAKTYYGGHAPDLPWLDPARAMEMAKRTYDQLEAYAAKRGVKNVKFTWAQIKPDIEALMGETLNKELSREDKARYRSGFQAEMGKPGLDLWTRDRHFREKAWQKAIEKRFRVDVEYRFNLHEPWSAREFADAMSKVKPPKGFIPTITSVDDFVKLYKPAYEKFKERVGIVGDEGWFGLLKNVYENLNTKD